MFAEKQLRLLAYLKDHPGWHYATGLVLAGLCRRWNAHIRLAQLVEYGLVDVEVDPVSAGMQEGTLPRSRYQFAGGQWTFGSSPFGGYALFKIESASTAGVKEP